MRCPRCRDVDLLPPDVGGAALSASTCPRCGGGLIPEEGARRLLEEELGHDRQQLVELANLVGGTKLPCPACGTKASPVQLRGAHVELCFGCGALWVDRGELEQVSSGRYALPAPTAPPPPAHGEALVPTQALVRIDQGSVFWRFVRDAAVFAGVVGFLAWLSAIADRHVFWWWLGALAFGVVLSRRHAIDVHPRARRFMEWRGFLPPPRLEGGGDLPTDAMLVCRAHRLGRFRIRFARIDIVDGDGRVMIRVRRAIRTQSAVKLVQELGRSLGMATRVDRAPVVEEMRALAIPLTTAAHLDLVPLDNTPEKRRRFAIRDPDGKELGEAFTEMPMRDAASTLAELTDEHWILADTSTGARVRLLPSARGAQRTTLVVDDKGEGLGHILARRRALLDVVEWWSPKRRRGARVRALYQQPGAKITDDWGRVVGVLEIHDPSIPRISRVTLRLDAGSPAGAARWCFLAMALHVSLLRAVVDE